MLVAQRVSSSPPPPPCAQARVASLMLALRSRANPQGDPFQRVAFYFLEGLWARTCGTGASYYNLPLLVSQPVSMAHRQCIEQGQTHCWTYCIVAQLP